MKCSYYIVLILFFLFSSNSLPTTLPQTTTEVSFEKDTSLPLVMINIVIPIGSTIDPPDYAGLTEFLGEMLLRGTAQKTKLQLDMAIEQLGAELKIETRAESLILRGSVLSERLSPFLKILAEIFNRPRFSLQEIQKLKQETLASIENHLENDQYLASQKFKELFFHQHPYRYPTIGKPEHIARFNSKILWKHYHRFIATTPRWIIGTGDASQEILEKWSQTLKIQQKPFNPPSTPTFQQAPSHRTLWIIDKPNRTQTQIYVGHLGIQITHPHYYALTLANHAWGGNSFSSILMKKIRTEKGWSYGASSQFKWAQQPHLWWFHLFPSEKDTAPALALALQLLEDFKNRGLSQEEFEFAKKSLIQSAGFAYNTPQKRVENKIFEKTMNLPDGFFKTYAAEIQKLTLSEVNHAIQQFIQPEKLCMSVLGTASKIQDSLQTVTQAKTVMLVPYNQH